MSMWDFNLVSVGALLISVVALIVSYERSKSASENLSLNAFMRTIDQYGETSIRKKRKYIFENIPNLLDSEKIVDDIPDIPNKVKLYTTDGNSNITEKKIWPDDLGIKEEEYFEEISVRLDRIGFLVINLDLSYDFKQKYYSWMCVSIIEMWNRLAPFIMKIRKERGKYVPYFEDLVIQLWPYYKKEVKNPKMFIFKPKIRHFS